MERLCRCMHSYQKENNIKKLCMDNATFFRDSINASFNENAEAITVFAVFEKNKDLCVCVHMVVKITDIQIIDPSYEIACNDNVEYVRDIKTLLKMKLDLKEEDKKHLITKFLRMKQYEDRMKTELLIVNKEYYNKQADYIQAKINN